MLSWAGLFNAIHPLLLLDNSSDHDERIPLFTRASETDPELPYGALLRYKLHVAQWRTFLMPYLALWTSKTTSSNSKLLRSSQFFYHLKPHQSCQTYSNHSSTPSHHSWLRHFLTNAISPFNVWKHCFPDAKCARLSGEFPR